MIQKYYVSPYKFEPPARRTQALCTPAALYCSVLYRTILYCIQAFCTVCVVCILPFYFYNFFGIDGGNLDLTNNATYEQTSGLPLF